MNPRRKDGSHGSLALAGIITGLLLALLGAFVRANGYELLSHRVYELIADLVMHWFPHSQVAEQIEDGYCNITRSLSGNFLVNGAMYSFWLEIAGALALVLSIFTWMRKKPDDDGERLRP